MLLAFVEMKDFVVKFLDSSSIGLVEYALTPDEWDAIEDLVYVMKVRILLFLAGLYLHYFIVSERCNGIFLFEFT